MTSMQGDSNWTNQSSSTNGDAGSTSQAGDMVQQTAQKAQQASGQLADQAKQQISTQLQTQKDRATGGLGSLAQALRQTSQQLRDSGQEPLADYTAKGADGLERVTGFLSDRDITALREEAERLARRQPALFLAGAFGVGWLAARFFKSSTPPQQSAQGARLYTGYPGGRDSSFAYGGGSDYMYSTESVTAAQRGVGQTERQPSATSGSAQQSPAL